jgi:hypothetical protein
LHCTLSLALAHSPTFVYHLSPSVSLSSLSFSHSSSSIGGSNISFTRYFLVPF